jgi:hypothetical protein
MLAGLIVDLGQDITKGFLARKSVDEKWKLDLLCHTFKFKVDAGPELRQKKKKKKAQLVHHGRSVRRMGTHYESFGYGEMDTRKTQHEQISK